MKKLYTAVAIGVVALSVSAGTAKRFATSLAAEPGLCQPGSTAAVPQQAADTAKGGGAKGELLATAVAAKTIKLEFTLMGEEDRSFFVLCVTEEFSIDNDVSEPNFDHALKIMGRLESNEAKDGVFISFEATIHHADKNAGVDATFTTKGSAIVKLDKKVPLATLGGDQRLAVTASVVE